MGHAIRAFGCGDAHGKDRDPVACAVMEKAHAAFKPDKTIYGGDMISCEPFSRHPFRSLKETVKSDWRRDEIDPMNLMIDRMQRHTKLTVYVAGNHEGWVERWCAGLGSRGEAIESSLSPKVLLSEGRRNWEYVDWSDNHPSYSLADDLVVIHGWTACKEAARRHLELSRSRSVIFHHTHRGQYANGRNPWTNKVIEAQSAGCLCHFTPIYQVGGTPNDWVHGFWVAYIGKRSYTMYAVTIERNGCVLPDGREIRV